MQVSEREETKEDEGKKRSEEQESVNSAVEESRKVESSRNPQAEEEWTWSDLTYDPAPFLSKISPFLVVPAVAKKTFSGHCVMQETSCRP